MSPGDHLGRRYMGEGHRQGHYDELFSALSPDNKSHFERCRWPPVWYLKEEDRYLRCKKEREREEEMIRKLHSKSKWCFWRPSSSSSSSSVY